MKGFSKEKTWICTCAEGGREMVCFKSADIKMTWIKKIMN